MAIYYRAIIVGVAEPAAPGLGVIWIVPVSSSYQPYIWLGRWVELPGGGIAVDETKADTHYINVVVQEARPDGIAKAGWIWIQPSLKTAKLALLSSSGKPASDADYIVLAAA